MILEAEWEDMHWTPGRKGSPGLQTFLHDKFVVWASSGSNMWNNLKNVVYESIERFVPHKTLRINSDPVYYNKEIKRLKSKVRNNIIEEI